MAEEIGLRTGRQDPFERMDRAAPPLGPGIINGFLVVVIEMQRHRHAERARGPEHPQTVGTVIHGPAFDLAADFRPVDVMRGDQPTAGLRIARIGRAAQNETVRFPVVIRDAPFEGDRPVQRRRVDPLVVMREIFTRSAVPAQQPGLADSILIHIRQKFLQVVSPPVRMVVSVDDFHAAPSLNYSGHRFSNFSIVRKACSSASSMPGIFFSSSSTS